MPTLSRTNRRKIETSKKCADSILALLNQIKVFTVDKPNTGRKFIDEYIKPILLFKKASANRPNPAFLELYIEGSFVKYIANILQNLFWGAFPLPP